MGGQVGEAANHLVTLYRAISKQWENGGQPGVDWCAYASPLRATRENRNSVQQQNILAPATGQALRKIEARKPKGMAGQLEGVELNGVRKIAVMKVPDETKSKAVSKLVEKDERLAVLVCGGGGATWDAEGKTLVGTPDWAEVLKTIATVEKEREEPEVQEGAEEDEDAPEERREQAQARAGAMYDDEQILTESEAKGLQRCVCVCVRL